MRDVLAETVLMQPGDAGPLNPSSRADGTTLYPGQAISNEFGRQKLAELTGAPSNLPTLVVATPRSGSGDYKNQFSGYLYNEENEDADNNRIMMSTTQSGKKFSLGNSAHSRQPETNMVWMTPASDDSRNPSNLALSQGYIGTNGNPMLAQPPR